MANVEQANGILGSVIPILEMSIPEDGLSKDDKRKLINSMRAVEGGLKQVLGMLE